MSRWRSCECLSVIHQATHRTSERSLMTAGPNKPLPTTTGLPRAPWSGSLLRAQWGGSKLTSRLWSPAMPAPSCLSRSTPPAATPTPLARRKPRRTAWSWSFIMARSQLRAPHPRQRRRLHPALLAPPLRRQGPRPSLTVTRTSPTAPSVLQRVRSPRVNSGSTTATGGGVYSTAGPRNSAFTG